MDGSRRRHRASDPAAAPSSDDVPSSSASHSSSSASRGGDRVTVAVRVRPWLDAKLQPTRADRSRCAVQINGNTAEVIDPRTRVSRGRFTFDHCFDSFEPGVGADKDQARLFDTLAPPLVASALQGYNVTMLAYGQTASGKTYTMLGSDAAPGFIPRFIRSIFAGCARLELQGVTCTFEASYMEIYMEHIRDLLNPGGAAGSRPGLRVREHPQTGPYVEDLAKVACKSSEQVTQLLTHGASVRAVRATRMNAESSRSHAIFTLRLTQKEDVAAELRPPAAAADSTGAASAEKVSLVHLVDLAGSERAKRTGTEKVAEASAINRSLSALGAVIAALASSTRSHVPYRDSVLTYLLKDGLGGNARTTMLSSVSPSGADLPETLSTLRYADSAKRIINHATPNLDPSLKLVRQLRDEIDDLRRQIASSASGGGAVDADREGALREQLRISEKLMEDAQMCAAGRRTPLTSSACST